MFLESKICLARLKKKKKKISLSGKSLTHETLHQFLPKMPIEFLEKAWIVPEIILKNFATIFVQMINGFIFMMYLWHVITPFSSLGRNFRN
jgi:hypothetical protein